GRHLRQLARWPQRIADGLPGPDMLVVGGGFWNAKLPVFSKLVDPPHATPETQRAALAALFGAAQALEGSPRRPPGARVAVMATTPSLFDSEVILFLDEDYFRSFLPPAATARTPLW